MQRAAVHRNAAGFWPCLAAVQFHGDISNGSSVIALTNTPTDRHY